MNLTQCHKISCFLGRPLSKLFYEEFINKVASIKQIQALIKEGPIFCTYHGYHSRINTNHTYYSTNYFLKIPWYQSEWYTNFFSVLEGKVLRIKVIFCMKEGPKVTQDLY